ncbi:hypothetical protein QE152_g21759 [Popillia japonica]|uniref:Uncharacterized protein n=1 Tax=Popillia japonica TaxID=7064 RepID=A0AAW1KND9_POPJA
MYHRVSLTTLSKNEEHLKRAGLDVVSAITFVTAGLNKPEYKHIFSFRRQAYIHFEQNSELPQSLIIKQDIITVANELNLGLDSLLKTLIISSKKATTNNLRSRLKRIIKKIKMKNDDKRDSLQYDSDISLSQDYSSDHSESSINLAALH